MPSSLSVALSVAKSGQPAHYLPVLTGLRAIAAYLVFLHHHNPAPSGTFMYCLLDQGYIGVTIFFVLSGFLIYYRYVEAFSTSTNQFWLHYLQNRFARIFPLYLVLVLVTISLHTWAGRPTNWLVFLMNISLVKGFFDTYKFTGLAQSWSLTVEICFYIAAPFFFKVLRRFGPIRLSVGLFSIGVLLWTFTNQWPLSWTQTGSFFGTLPFVAFYTFFGRSFEFLIGMWLAQQWLTNRLSDVKSTAFCGIGFVSACVVWQASVTNFVVNPTYLFGSELIVYNYGLPVGIGLFVHDLLLNRSTISRWLSSSCMQTLGRSSYAFYLVHNGVIAHGLQRAGITNEGLLFLVLLLMAHGLYVCFEKPLYNWIRASGSD